MVAYCSVVTIKLVPIDMPYSTLPLGPKEEEGEELVVTCITAANSRMSTVVGIQLAMILIMILYNYV